MDDALIQPYSSHEGRKSPEVYSLLAIGAVQERHDDVSDRYPT